jgi:hypothetical membrane protein
VQKVEHEKTAVHKIGEHIFNGSIAMVGVCLTVIALFSIGKSNVTTYADKILAIMHLFLLFRLWCHIYP